MEVRVQVTFLCENKIIKPAELVALDINDITMKVNTNSKSFDKYKKIITDKFRYVFLEATQVSVTTGLAPIYSVIFRYAEVKRQQVIMESPANKLELISAVLYGSTDKNMSDNDRINESIKLAKKLLSQVNEELFK